MSLSQKYDTSAYLARSVSRGMNHKYSVDVEANEANGLPKNTKFCDHCGKSPSFFGKKYDNSCDVQTGE